MKQYFIGIILLGFLSGCSVHMHQPRPHYVQKQNTVYVTKYKTKVIHRNVYKSKVIYKHKYKHAHKRYKYIPKKKKRVIVRYY